MVLGKRKKSNKETNNTAATGGAPVPEAPAQLEPGNILSTNTSHHTDGNVMHLNALDVVSQGVTVSGSMGAVVPLAIQNNSPEPVESALSSISDGVAESLTDKIMKGEYVDLGNLLVHSELVNNSQKISIVNGELVVHQQLPKKKILNVDMWTDAFIKYISIYCSAHPHRFTELLKYMYIIRHGARRVTGEGWRQYDEQFRLRQARNPSGSWANVDMELWLLYMTEKGINAPRWPGNSARLQNPSALQANLKCYPYNYETYCYKQYCVYSHTCLRCGGDHPMAYCPHLRAGRIVASQRNRFPNQQFVRQTVIPPTQLNSNRFSTRTPSTAVRYQAGPRVKPSQPAMGFRQNSY